MSQTTVAGVDPERLARIPARMQAFVDKGTIAGAVILVARHGEVALLEAVGYQDLESKKPMRTDTIFATRSMQKSITAVGIMILLEEGRLTLADPVEKHFPEFRDQVVIDKADGDKVLTTKKPSRPITIRDLLTHTSGVPGEPYREPFKSWLEELSKKRDKTLAEVVSIYSQEPLEFEPGTRYLYSDLGFSILARIIEVASGQAYDDFLEQRILRPLGMRDTFFFVPLEKDGRIASAYRLENGQLTKIAVYGDVKIDPFSAPAPLFRRGTKLVSGAGGWFSTATDMFAFYQMMMNGGAYKGVRILSRASVELMTTVHTGDHETVHPGIGYGLGWQVVRDPRGASYRLGSIGSYGHGGFLGTLGWIDPKRGLIGVFMIQQRRSPEEERMRLFRLRDTFIVMANAAIAD